MFAAAINTRQFLRFLQISPYPCEIIGNLAIFLQESDIWFSCYLPHRFSIKRRAAGTIIKYFRSFSYKNANNYLHFGLYLP